MKNVAYKVIDNLMISVHNENPPTNSEFEACLTAFKTIDLNRVRLLVFTQGGASTPAQRKKMNDLLQGRGMLTAVVSDALIIRGVVTALSWFNDQIRSFPSVAAEDAFRYLGIPPTSFGLIWREVRKLQVQLERGVQHPKSIMM